MSDIISQILDDPRLHRDIDRAAVLMDAETDLIDCEATEQNTAATENHHAQH